MSKLIFICCVSVWACGCAALPVQQMAPIQNPVAPTVIVLPEQEKGS